MYLTFTKAHCTQPSEWSWYLMTDDAMLASGAVHTSAKTKLGWARIAHRITCDAVTVIVEPDEVTTTFRFDI